MSEQQVESFLAHYGIKGMRWGVRKSRNEIDRLKPAADRDKPTVTSKALSVLKSKFAKTPLKEMREKQLTDNQKKALDDSLLESDELTEGGD